MKARYVHEVGGHFPAWENPDLLAGDVWSFIGDAQLSGTGVFQRNGDPLVEGREL